MQRRKSAGHIVRWILRHATAWCMIILLCGCGERPEPSAAAATAETKVAPTKAPPPQRKVSPKYKPRPLDTSAGLKFTPGAFSGITPEPGATHPATRIFTNADPGQDAEVASILASIQSDSSKQNGLEAIARLSALETPQVFTAVDKLLSHPETEVRGLALGLLEGVQDAAVRPLVERALRDRDPDVRLRAIDILASAAHEAPDNLLIRALEDRDANVRASAMLAGNQLEPPARQRVLERAAASLQPEIAITALQLLDAEPNKSNVPLFIKALSHPAAEVREAAQDMMSLTFYDEFPDAATAARWWSANQHRFSNTLEELKPAAP